MKFAVSSSWFLAVTAAMIVGRRSIAVVSAKDALDTAMENSIDNLDVRGAAVAFLDTVSFW